MADKVPVIAAGLLLGGFVLTVLWSPFGPPVILLGVIGLMAHLVRAFSGKTRSRDASSDNETSR